MLNQIEKEFEGFMVAMYGNKTISEAQEKDMEKAFYGGMMVTYNFTVSLSESEDIAIEQLNNLRVELLEKIESFTASLEGE